MERSIVEAILPSGLLNYFDITGFAEEHDKKSDQKIIVVDLTEKNQIGVDGCSFDDYQTKDFYPPKRVQDFPLRGLPVYLCFNRRRWRHKIDKNKVISNDYSFIAEGSKITKELSDFLKYGDKEPRRYHQ